MAKALRLVLAMVFLAPGVGGLRADPYCDFYAGKLTSPGVYVARCADNVDCLLGPLPQGTPYEVDHRYRTVVFASGANAHNNSVVVAKIKYLSGAPTAAAPPIAVEMQRDNIPFVCFGSDGSVLPPEREQNADAYDAAHKLIHYDEYDRFHRFVEVRSDDQKWLQRTFHFSFKAKSSDWLFQCQDTRWLRLRRQFLFHSPEVATDGQQAFVTAFSNVLAPTSAYGGVSDDFHKADAALGIYRSLRLRVLAYEGDSAPQECVSFRYDVATPGMDLAIDDLHSGIFAGLNPSPDVEIRIRK